MEPVADTLVDLLGESRGRVVELLHERPRSVADLAGELCLSEVAVRRHLRLLEQEGLVTARTIRRPGPGRPGSRYELTDRAVRLFPDHSAEFANELLEYLRDQHGSEALDAFLRWRAEQQGARYARALADAGPDVPARVTRLADLLSEDGFETTVEPTEGPEGRVTLKLTQGHCAIREVARQHPDICVLEAQMFEDLLGVGVSRRQTATGGAGQCVCTIPAEAAAGDAAGSGNPNAR